jgi:hypothetical protein
MQGEGAQGADTRLLNRALHHSGVALALARPGSYVWLLVRLQA